MSITKPAYAGFDGAGRENRTLMRLPPQDFESCASTNSAIPAWDLSCTQCVRHSTSDLLTRQRLHAQEGLE